MIEAITRIDPVGAPLIIGNSVSPIRRTITGIRIPYPILDLNTFII
jgi:hypothetical protein